jgi:hypothetical protein
MIASPEMDQCTYRASARINGVESHVETKERLAHHLVIWASHRDVMPNGADITQTPLQSGRRLARNRDKVRKLSTS